MNFMGENNNGEDIYKKKIKTVVNDYKISLETLSKITGIDYIWLNNYFNGKENNKELSDFKTLDLWSMLNMLTDGITLVNEDDRISGVIDVLVSEFEINLETLAIYAGLETKDMESFMRDTNSISYEKKYKLATVTLFLHYLFKQPFKIKMQSD